MAKIYYVGKEHTFTVGLADRTISDTDKKKINFEYSVEGGPRKSLEGTLHVTDLGDIALKTTFKLEDMGNVMVYAFYNDLSQQQSLAIKVVERNSGLKIIGSQKECLLIYENLQKLTNDKLDFNTDTSKVYIEDGNPINTDKNLKNGTLLIGNIINTTSNNVVSIISVERFRASKTKEDVALDGTPLNKFEGNATVYQQPYKNKFNGIGVNVTIVFDSNDLGNEIKNEDGSTGRPIFIGLAHELIHASNGISGKVDEGDAEDDLEDPDSNMEGILDPDEVWVREEENKIRAEQKVILRAEPIDNTAKNLNNFLNKQLDD